MNLTPDMSYFSDIYFESGAIKKLPALLGKLGIQNPLLITDKGLVELGFVSRLGLKEPCIFDEVLPNPTEANALAAEAFYRKNHCDGILALGGGSPIDLAKCAGILVSHQAPLERYTFLNGGTARIVNDLPPLLAIPTTAGSGSEVGRAALLTLESGRKMAFLSARLLPTAVLCDPDFTEHSPRLLTAGAGMDALSHCIETYLSPRMNRVADTLALEGLRIGIAALKQLLVQGEDIKARAEMMLCSLMAGLAFQKGLGAVHSLSHPLGALTEKKLHHGTLNGIFLPHVLRFNMPAAPKKMREIAKIIGADEGNEVPAYFDSYLKLLGLPTKLEDLGLNRADLDPLAVEAHQDHCTPTNPRALTEKGCAELYAAAF